MLQLKFQLCALRNVIEIKVKRMATYSENKGENKHLSNSSFLLDKSHKKKSLSLSADMREITRL